jgi:hypothetical protein
LPKRALASATHVSFGVPARASHFSFATGVLGVALVGRRVLVRRHDLLVRLGIGFCGHVRRLGLFQADVLGIPGLVVALLLGDVIRGIGFCQARFVTGTVARLVGGVELRESHAFAALGLGVADVLGIAGHGSQAALAVL